LRADHVRFCKRDDDVFEKMSELTFFDPDTHLIVRVVMAFDQFELHDFVFLFLLPRVQNVRAIDKNELFGALFVKI
jgi:hypothetical protein